MAHDSDTWRGRRHIAGGRATVRCALHTATLAAIHCSPAIKAFHKRLRDAGNPPKVALVAAMRKFIIMINTILKRRTPWNSPNNTVGEAPYRRAWKCEAGAPTTKNTTGGVGACPSSFRPVHLTRMMTDRCPRRLSFSPHRWGKP
nr:hypothetical protein [Rhizobium leguminosarum]